MNRLVSSIGIFAELCAHDREALSLILRKKTFAAGDVLFHEGDVGDCLFALASGRVDITISSSDGEEIELTTVGPGGFFGELAIIDGSRRSATCTVLEQSVCLLLCAADFETLIIKEPGAAAAVLDRMIRVAADRLVKTGSFLSQMVQWGDSARKRAITDAATGLFNRRYLEDSFETVLTGARREKKPLSFAMFDLDRFGKLNAEYGAAFCDEVILRLSAMFRTVFDDEDIAVRYGGDEFCFIIRGDAREALAKCEAVSAAVRSMDFPGHRGLSVTCSMGLADFPAVAGSARALKDKADKALYRAKEAGRDRTVVWDLSLEEGIKHEIRSIAQKNRIVANFTRVLCEKESFLVIGHKDPDEDCVSAMVAFALLATKFNKKAVVALGSTSLETYDYLWKICHYNSIEISQGTQPPPCAVLVIVDTAKSELIDRQDIYQRYRGDSSVLKLEIDHHLGADSHYSGDPGYRLVYEASSSCEILGYFALKLDGNRALLESYGIPELLSRNIVLSILSGIIGDTQMGKYLESRREKWFYKRFSTMFETLLARKTRSGSGNFSNRQQVFDALASLSCDEEACFTFFMSRAQVSGPVHYVVLTAASSHELFTTYGVELSVSVSKGVVNQLSEDSGFLGLVAYLDEPDVSPFAQFRLRRSHAFAGLDLREVLQTLSIQNGGGHPGAVGFRIERKDVGDLGEKTAEIVAALTAMVSSCPHVPVPEQPDT